MKNKLELIYDELERLAPPHGPEYHRYNLARCHLLDILRAHGGRTKYERGKDALINRIKEKSHPAAVSKKLSYIN
jgi:hypothetical protein